MLVNIFMCICISFHGLKQHSFCFTEQDEQREWVAYHKKKWQIQLKQRKAERSKRRRTDTGDVSGGAGLIRHGGSGVGDFLRRKARSMFDQPWQIVQVRVRGSYGRWGSFMGCDAELWKGAVITIYRYVLLPLS